MELTRYAILARLRDDREITAAVADALRPLFQGADVDDAARLANIGCGLLLDVLAGLDTDRARQALGALAAYAKQSQRGPLGDRAAIFGKGF